MKSFIVLGMMVALVAGAAVESPKKASAEQATDGPAKNHGKRGLLDFGYGHEQPELQGGFKPSFGYDLSSEHPALKSYSPEYSHYSYQPSDWKHEKHTFITKKVPVPYPVQVEKHVFVEKKVPVHIDRPVPYAVEVEKKVPVIVEKHVPVHIDRPVPYPVKVPYRVEVEKKVPVYVEKKIHIDRPVPYPVKVKVPVYHKVEVEVPKPYPVHIPKPYPVYIEKEVVKTVDRPVPVEVEKKVHIPVIHRVEVEKPYPVYVEKPVLVEKVEEQHIQQHDSEEHHEEHEQPQQLHHHHHHHEDSHEEHHHIHHHNIQAVGVKATDFISEPIHVSDEHQYGEESQKVERKVESNQQIAEKADRPVEEATEKAADKESH